MDYIKILKKIATKVENCDLVHLDFNDRWFVSDRDTGGQSIAGGDFPTPEEAIEAAYKELFSFIPEKVGCWSWRRSLKRWVSDGGTLVERHPDRGQEWFKFTCGVLVDGDIDKFPSSPWLSDEEVEDIKKLRKINRNFDPPTEEEE